MLVVTSIATGYEDCPIYRIFNLPLPPSIDFALWRCVLRAELASSQRGYQSQTHRAATPAKAVSETSNQGTWQLDASAPVQEFKQRTQSRCSLAEEFQSAVGALLTQLQS